MFAPNQTCPHCDGAVDTHDQCVIHRDHGWMDTYMLCKFCAICIYGCWEPAGSSVRLHFELDYCRATEPDSYRRQVAEMRSLQRRRATAAAVAIERRRRKDTCAA